MADPRDVFYADQRMMSAGVMLDELVAAARSDVAAGERSDSLAALKLSEELAAAWRDDPERLTIAADAIAVAVYRFVTGSGHA